MKEAIVRVRYKASGYNELKKQITDLTKRFNRLVAAGKKAGLTKNEIGDMIKFEVTGK
jgi:cell division protein FtsL